MTDRTVINLSDWLGGSSGPRSFAPQSSAAPVVDQDTVQDAVVVDDAVPTGPAGAAPSPAPPTAAAVSGKVVKHQGRDVPPGPPLPAWASREGLRPALSHVRLTAAAHAKYHAALAPVYVFAWAPRGGWRLAKVWARWVRGDYAHLIREAKSDLRAASGRKDKHGHHVAIRRYRQERRRHRASALALTAAGGAAGYAGLLMLSAAAGPLAVAGVAVAVVAAGAIGGRPHAADGTPAALPGPRNPMLGEDSIVSALIRAKVISEAQREDTRLLEPVHQDGAGLATVVELPPGVSAKALMAAHDSFASALRVHSFWLVLELVTGAGSHQGTVRIWRGSSDPFVKTYPSPLLKVKGAWNTWTQGIPMGVTGRGSQVCPRLNDLSLLIGGQPRRGKSLLVTEAVAAALLDPTILIRLIDGKGAADYDVLAPVLATFFKLDPERLLMLLQLVIARMEETYELLSREGKRKVDWELIASGKVRRELIVIDELRWYTTNKKFGPAIVLALTDIASRGPAAAVTLVMATQRTTVDVVPGTLRGTVSARAAMRVDDAKSSNAILGDGRAGQGYDASMIPGDVEHRGMFLLDADGADPLMLKGFYLDEEQDLPRIAQLAYEIREKAGALPDIETDPVEEALMQLTGISSVAGGPTGRGKTSNLSAADLAEQSSQLDFELLPTYAAIFAAFAAAGEPEFLSTTRIAAHLAAADPAAWGGDLFDDDAAFGVALGKALSAELRAAGIEGDAPRTSRRRDGGPNPVRGYLRTDLEAALGLAEAEQDPDDD